MTDKEMKVHEKQEVRQSGEPTKAERHFVPAVDICESAEAVMVTAEMPGVSCSGVDIKLEDGVLTLQGTMTAESLEGRRILLKEYETGSYIRRFTISEVIDQDRIEASMADGILRLVLPKVQPAKPRKIEIQAR